MYLAMLAEWFHERVGAKLLAVNTDGLEFIIKKDQYEKALLVAKDWEEYTNLILEEDEYSKMCIRDINNYIAIYTNGKVKYKGAYEIMKDYHKDNSQRVVNIAVARYFVNDIPIEDTIINHCQVTEYPDLTIKGKPVKSHCHFDFMKMIRARGAGKKGRPKMIYFDKIGEKEMPRLNRYYISKKGGKLIKRYKDKTETTVLSGPYFINVVNKGANSHVYDDINYDYYLREARKLIEPIAGNKQLKLF